jgi:dynein heavy chain, axonemal
MQAVQWIKEKEASNGLEILSFNNPKFLKTLEGAIQFGKSVLFEAIDTEIDPMIDPVLEKNIVINAGVKYIKLGDTQVEWEENFKLFLTTKLSNPYYPPEVFGKTMIINFMVTMQGLSDQLLNVVVGYEKPELERLRKLLITETSENRSTLKGLEDVLLYELSTSTGDIVENENLINTLAEAKTKAMQIEKALEKAKITSADIEENRENYKGVARRGAILFFAMAGLSNISSMYEYSLQSYLKVFLISLDKSRKDSILQSRLKNITDKLTTNVYDFTCMGIFEVHKLMFSFQMTTLIMKYESDLDPIEMDFFLKGNTSLEAVKRKKTMKWISESGWKDLQKLNDMAPRWNNIINNLVDHEPQWKKWYDNERPEDIKFPDGYSDWVTPFQQLMIMRIFRPDRVYNAIKQFIIAKMGDEHYVSPLTPSTDKIFEQSSATTPIVYILSPGADPHEDIEKLCEAQNEGTKAVAKVSFKYVSLGQGMGDRAKSLIKAGTTKGHWVLLENCHLLTSWLKDLEIIIESLEDKKQKPDPNFRLWLTTAPTDLFPLGIL